MGQLCRLDGPSTDLFPSEGSSSGSCSSALGVLRGSGTRGRRGDRAGDPGRPPAPRNTRYERPGSLPRAGGGGKGVQEKVSVPTVKLSMGARSGLRLGSCKTGSSDRAGRGRPSPAGDPGPRGGHRTRTWPGNAGNGGSSPSTLRSALATRSSSAHSRAHSPPSGGDPGGSLRGLGRREAENSAREPRGPGSGAGGGPGGRAQRGRNADRAAWPGLGMHPREGSVGKSRAGGTEAGPRKHVGGLDTRPLLCRGTRGPTQVAPRSRRPSLPPPQPHPTLEGGLRRLRLSLVLRAASICARSPRALRK